MKVRLLQFPAILFLIVTALFAENSADFMIAALPKAFIVLDHYEQPLSGAKKARLIAYSPFLIINEEGMLGDQITPALQFSLHGQTFFLLRDEEGNFAGDKTGQAHKIYKNCTQLNDTVQVVRDRAVLLSEQYPAAGSRVFLKKRDRLLRVFKYRNSYYVLRTGESPRYGWCSVSARHAWRVLKEKKDTVSVLFSPMLKERILDRVASANTAYEKYFNYFNQKSSNPKTVPEWQCASNDTAISCVLDSKDIAPAMLKESTRYLVSDLENLLIGKPFLVAYKAGEIIIQLKSVANQK
jgi:hypothetical protein